MIPAGRFASPLSKTCKKEGRPIPYRISLPTIGIFQSSVRLSLLRKSCALIRESVGMKAEAPQSRQVTLIPPSSTSASHEAHTPLSQ